MSPAAKVIALLQNLESIPISSLATAGHMGYPACSRAVEELNQLNFVEVVGKTPGVRLVRWKRG